MAELEIIGAIGMVLVIIGFWKGDNGLRLICVGMYLLLTVGILALLNKNSQWSDLLKLSKELENKEIVSIEMENDSLIFSTDSIETITYIDADGVKTEIDCSALTLPYAHVKESDDSKYHITIIEDKDIIVYIPVITEYTSK